MIENPSYVRGASAPPLMYETIGRALERAAERWPDREAIVVRHQQRRLSYGQLNTEADQLATGLLALGLEPGEHKAFLVSKSAPRAWSQETPFGSFSTAKK